MGGFCRRSCASGRTTAGPKVAQTPDARSPTASMAPQETSPLPRSRAALEQARRVLDQLYASEESVRDYRDKMPYVLDRLDNVWRTIRGYGRVPRPGERPSARSRPPRHRPSEPARAHSRSPEGRNPRVSGGSVQRTASVSAPVSRYRYNLPPKAGTWQPRRRRDRSDPGSRRGRWICRVRSFPGWALLRCQQTLAWPRIVLRPPPLQPASTASCVGSCWSPS